MSHFSEKTYVTARCPRLSGWESCVESYVADCKTLCMAHNKYTRLQREGFFSPSSEQALLEYVSALRKQGKVERVEALTVALLQL